MRLDEEYKYDFEQDPGNRTKKIIYIVIVIVVAFSAEYTLMMNLL